MNEISAIANQVKPKSLVKNQTKDSYGFNFLDVAKAGFASAQLAVAGKGIKDLGLKKKTEKEFNYFNIEEEEEKTLQGLIERLQDKFDELFQN